MVGKRSLKTFAAVALACLSGLVLAEERSVLDQCTMSSFDRDQFLTYNDKPVCDGGFKTMTFSTSLQVNGSTLDKEVVIVLPASQVIISSFVLNVVYTSSLTLFQDRFGTSALYIGDDGLPFSNNLTKVTPNIFDGGFHKLNPPAAGKYIVLRRSGPGLAGNPRYSIEEIRLYQTTNLLLELAGSVTISAPASVDETKWPATNLITNLGSRSGGNDLPPRIALGTSASFHTCYKTSTAQVSAYGHILEININLGKPHFMHSILAVQDLYSGWNPAAMDDRLKFFQNYEIHIGNSPNFAENPKCPEGPHMVTTDSKSYLNVSYTYGAGYTGPVWKFGLENWCNMEGQFMTIVADLRGLAGQTSLRAPNGYEMSLCHLAIFGAIYKRNQVVPTTLLAFIGKLQTLEIEKITADPATPIGNILDIMLRQKVGTELPWVQLVQTSPSTQVVINPGSTVALGDTLLTLESFDNNGGVYSALKTDTITVRVLPSECGQVLSQSAAFESTQPISLIKEYEPTIFFPEVLFTGPNSFTGYTCGGTYTQSIQIDTPVAGVVLTDQPSGPDMRPRVTVDSTAPSGSTFTLTFSGRYSYAPLPNEITASFTQTYKVKTVFSTEFVEQPALTHQLTSDQLTFTVPPASTGTPPPTQTLQASAFTAVYAIKAGVTDSLGNTPPAISPVPYGGFSIAELAKGQSTLGSTTLTNPLGSLGLLGGPTFTGDLTPGSTIQFQCEPWLLGKANSQLPMTLRFQNNIEQNFKASQQVTCSYKEYRPPSLSTPLEPVELTTGATKSWSLPSRQMGSFGVSTVKFQPDPALLAFLQFDEAANSVIYDGNPALLSLRGQQHLVKFTLVDALGIETEFSQIVTVADCRISQTDFEALSESLASDPLNFSLQAHKEGFQSLSYSKRLDQVTRSFDLEKQRLVCGNITVNLLSAQNTFIKHDAALRLVQVFATKDTGALTLESTSLQVTVGKFAIRIPIKVTFFECTIAALSFERPFQQMDYVIGSGSLQVDLPKVRQRPDCSVPFETFKIESIQSALPVERVTPALTLESTLKAVFVSTNDLSFAGHQVNVTVAINQSQVREAQAFSIQIAFKSAPPSFNTTALVVNPITCSRKDSEWSLLVPPVVSSGLEPVVITLQDRTMHSNMFSLSAGTVRLKTSFQQDFINGVNCPSDPEITLEFQLSSALLGENLQTIKVPVQPQTAAQIEGVASFEGIRNPSQDQMDATSKNEQPNLDMKQGRPKKTPAKLEVQALDVSPSGQMTIRFTKSIVTPALKASASSGQRALTDIVEHEIGEVIEVSILDAAQEDGKDKSIASVEFVQADNQTVTCQLKFNNTVDISPDIRDPDTLGLHFLKPSVFVDVETGQTLDKNSWYLQTKVQQQFTAAQYEQMQATAKAAATAGAVMTVWEFIMLFCFQKALLSMWFLILTLQFFVYLSLWQIRFPYRIRLLLYELKRIALGEFIDDFEIGNRLASAFGIEQRTQDVTEEKIGAERLGESELSQRFGPSLILITLICLFVLVVGVLVILVGKKITLSQKGKERLQQLKTRLCYSPFIRYAYLNALKLNMSCYMVFKSSADAPSKDLVGAIALFSAISLIPLVFFCVIQKNRSRLTDEEIVKRYGSLYAGKNVHDTAHRAQYMPLAFFLRRTLFIVVTVFLFDYPSLQMAVHIVLTLAMVGYLAHDPRTYLLSRDRVVDVGSEVCLLVATIFLSLFNEASYSEEARAVIEGCVLTTFAVLLSLNLGFTVRVSVEERRDRRRKVAWEARRQNYEREMRRRETMRTFSAPEQPPNVIQLERISEESEPSDSDSESNSVDESVSSGSSSSESSSSGSSSSSLSSSSGSDSRDRDDDSSQFATSIQEGTTQQQDQLPQRPQNGENLTQSPITEDGGFGARLIFGNMMEEEKMGRLSTPVKPVALNCVIPSNLNEVEEKMRFERFVTELKCAVFGDGERQREAQDRSQRRPRIHVHDSRPTKSSQREHQ